MRFGTRWDNDTTWVRWPRVYGQRGLPQTAVRARAWGGALAAALLWPGNAPAGPLPVACGENHTLALSAPQRRAEAITLDPARRLRAGHAPTYTLIVPTRDLVDLLRGQLFTDSGRFYPCRTNPQCSAWGQDIAVSSPDISIDGQRLVFSVHPAGSYAMAQFFTPTVAGDLVILGGAHGPHQSSRVHAVGGLNDPVERHDVSGVPGGGAPAD